MKLVIVVPDGLPDLAKDELDGKTPLAAADTPNMDRMAAAGRLSRAQVLPPDRPRDSAVALMSLLGYDASSITGRGYYEALDAGVELPEGGWACRCQFVTAGDDQITDVHAGNLATAEARQLIAELNEQANLDGVRFHFSDRDNHLVTLSEGNNLDTLVPSPWEVIGVPFSEYLWAPGAEPIRRVLDRSREVLEQSEVNSVRVDMGDRPANVAYLWGAGRAAPYEPIDQRLKRPCALVSFSAMARGIGKATAAHVPDAPAPSDEPREELRHLAQAATAAMRYHALVVVHVGFPDNFALTRDARGKARAIELIDGFLLKQLLLESERLGRAGTEMRVAVVPSLMSDVTTRKHLADPVPVVTWGSGIEADDATAYTEAAAESREVVTGAELVRGLLAD